MSKSALDKIVKKREVYVTRITETYTIAVKAKTDSSQHNIFKVRYESLQEFYDSFKTLHNDVVGLIESDDDFKVHDKVRQNTDDFYFQTKDIYNQIFPTQSSSSGNYVSVPNTSSEHNELVKLNVPIFDGNLLQWTTFFDMFCSIIHDNPNISAVKKFRYLLSYLKGEPFNLLKSLPVTEDNYPVAYKILTDRYQNKRLLATSYWNSINNTQILKSNCSSKDLRTILDTFNENIAALDVLGFPTSQWQFPLFNMLLSRLNTSIRTSFEIEHSKIELPTYDHLKEFLKNHCRALESVQIMPNISQLSMQSHNFQKSPSSQSNQFKNHNYSSNQAKLNQAHSLVANTHTNSNPQFTSSSIQPNQLNSPSQLNSNSSTKFNHSYTKNQNQTKPKCKLCNKGFHSMAQCEVFLSKNINDRISYIKQNNACLNCLRFSHSINTCQSTYSCRSCNERHHSLLHQSQTNDSNSQNTFIANTPQMSQEFSLSTTQGNRNQFSGCTSLTTSRPSSTVLLSTTKVDILDSRGNYQTVRVVLDSASQANFITESCLNRLGLSRTKLSIPIHGINQAISNTNGLTICTMKPVGESSPILQFDLLVLPKVCIEMPLVQINPSNWTHISNLKLGDNTFHIPSQIDILLGAQAYSEVIRPGIIQGQPGQPIALKTVFGWVLLGKAQTLNDQSMNNQVLPMSCNLASLLTSSLDHTIRKFWEVESLSTESFLSPDEQQCESFYQKTVTRDETGRFTVSLPFRNIRPDLGDTYNQAYKCLLSLESKLLKKPTLYSQYSEFMNNYLINKHMSLVPKTEPKPTFVNYLPHHCIVRPEKSSTKVRVVFNASCKGSNGISLNSTLLAGPKLQTDINTILLKFRFHPIVFLADITQMFLQIKINPQDRDYQRLLWRFNPNDPIEEYRLNTVTFGVTSSPYLAIRTIQELANIEKQNYPEASRILLEQIFVDDICAGAESIESALSLQQDLIALLKSGCFELKKWASNHPKLLSNLSQEKCQIPISFDKENPIAIKVLGLQWDPKRDCMFYSYQPSLKPCTKRNILSSIASIFDPLGILSPISFLAKCLMQRLWISKVGWDEPVDKSIIEIWTQFQNELPTLATVELPRYIFSIQILRCQLLGFSDASELGYSACVYLRLELPDNVIKTSLIIGKSRVSPLKTISLPRLELLGSALLSDLLSFVLKAYVPLITVESVYAFTDSQVVLYWVSRSPHRCKTFVANRVSHIQQNIPDAKWYHVKSEENPADAASRGVTPAVLINHPLWFTGPTWLSLPCSSWELHNPALEDGELKLPEILQEEKPISLAAIVKENKWHFLDSLLERFSSLIRLQRILCHSRRIFYNFKNKEAPLKGPISIFELQHSLLILVKHSQSVHFSELICQIKNNQLLPKPFRKLAPFLDENGFIRVGGRLRHTPELSFESKHPLLLARSDRLTTLIIEQIHKENMHPGLTTVHYLLRQQFWILSPRKAIQSVLSKCLRCYRLRPRAYTPYQGDLPAFRVSQLKCFSHCTLDYAGPFQILAGKYRRAKVLKAYICIFVCASTRAIHIEVASDLTADCFIAAFRRFVARRGRCTNLYSDRGTNFQGANNQLVELSKHAAEHLYIKWHFFPSATPHFNGLSEAGVKSVKTHMHRVIGEQRLTYEELNTLLVQIEALLNSRPICAQSSDPNDLSPLTPGHFLTMEPLNSCPDPDLSHLKLNTLSRWQLVQRLNADFWKRWKNEYLNTLQQRSKWTEYPSKVNLNSLVLIKNENKPSLQWSIGRIVELHPGPDGHVRVVTVRTQQGLLRRPVVKLCPLPLN